MDKPFQIHTIVFKDLDGYLLKVDTPSLFMAQRTWDALNRYGYEMVSERPTKAIDLPPLEHR